MSKRYVFPGIERCPCSKVQMSRDSASSWRCSRKPYRRAVSTCCPLSAKAEPRPEYFGHESVGMLYYICVSLAYGVIAVDNRAVVNRRHRRVTWHNQRYFGGRSLSGDIIVAPFTGVKNVTPSAAYGRQHIEVELLSLLKLSYKLLLSADVAPMSESVGAGDIVSL